jgi:hypothetical protein
VSSADLLVKRKSAVPDDLRIKRGGDVLLSKNDLAEKLMLRCCESCGGENCEAGAPWKKPGASVLLGAAVPAEAGCWSVLAPFPFDFSSRLRGFLD